MKRKWREKKSLACILPRSNSLSDLKLYFLLSFLFKGIGGSTFFFTKNNIGSYMKAWSTNYKPVFRELNIII